MAFYGVKVDEAYNVVSILRNNNEQEADDTICFDCGNTISHLTSHRVTTTVGRAPKEIPDPQGRKDAAGNVIMIRIYIPVTIKGRMCSSCVGRLTPDQYTNKRNEVVGVFRNSQQQIVKVHFNQVKETLHGTTKSDLKADKPDSEQEVIEVRLSKDETVYVPHVNREDINPKVHEESFKKFGFSRGKDYRKYLRG